MSGVQQIKIAEDEAGQRLDRWFRRRFPQINQGRIEKLLRKGEIRVDGGRAKSNQRLESGQTIRVPPLPDEAPEPSWMLEDAPRATVSDADARMIRDCVLWRDEHLIALNKPPGLAVQGGTNTIRHLDGMAEALAFDGDPPKLVHRLDRDTSGVILLARTGRAAAALAKGFHAKTTRKIYWAAVAGAPHPSAGTIRFGLVKSGGDMEKMHCIHPNEVESTPGAKRATTDYMIIDAAAKRTSWVALAPITGRTHQLRAHMAEIGHPVVGDGKYGTNRQTNEGDGWGAQLGGSVSRKLHLHARSIALDHPITGARVSFTAPLPEHMAHTWEMFGWNPRDAAADPFEELE
ncbi:RluA family pseudouridine synthase [Paroceanicella profunda]|uniref:Pseudouridine synthase n=1 Tax=Paroceanicella profunda TaxID=2579971 RepID=A0A5B8FTB7_9RHOB|nr:RluA family pseudouridine synthase [Paroceanicella profunda]QDL90584.1 RluA family pseudouridine synthase [Paroceanicella profunda]